MFSRSEDVEAHALFMRWFVHAVVEPMTSAGFRGSWPTRGELGPGGLDGVRQPLEAVAADPCLSG